MQDYAADEAVSELVTDPGQMPGVVAVRSTGRLDLDPDNTLGADLGEDVDLVATLFLTKVVEPDPVASYGRLGPQLCCDEGVEHATKEVPVAK